MTILRLYDYDSTTLFFLIVLWNSTNSVVFCFYLFFVIEVIITPGFLQNLPIIFYQCKQNLILFIWLFFTLSLQK